MNILNPTPARCVGFQPSSVLCPTLSGPRMYLAASLLLAGLCTAPAANISLNKDDARGDSSFNSDGNWSSGAAPSAGKTYATENFTLRTPADANDYTFAGDSLSVDAGGRLIGKTKGTKQVITVNKLILNGGVLEQVTENFDNFMSTWDGNIIVEAPSGLGAIGGMSNDNKKFEVLNITAQISGSAPLMVSGLTLNHGEDTGVVRLSAANPYNGNLTVSCGVINNKDVIASEENRILQLNHLDALMEATLTLNSRQPNPVSFAANANTGTFRVGALAGMASQTLTDTAGAPVVLSIGKKNVDTTYSGALTGSGALVKTGTGVQTLAGVNNYTGNTTILGGTLALAATGSFGNTPIIAVANGATLDVWATSFTLGASQRLMGCGKVHGSVNAVGGARIYAGVDGTFGTNAISGNLFLEDGVQIGLDLGAKCNGANDLITVGGDVVFSNTTFHLKAPSSSANLDAGDYTLMTIEGNISGKVAAAWDSPPANAANYAIVIVGNAIKLCYYPPGFGSK